MSEADQTTPTQTQAQQPQIDLEAINRLVDTKVESLNQEQTRRQLEEQQTAIKSLKEQLAQRESSAVEAQATRDQVEKIAKTFFTEGSSPEEVQEAFVRLGKMGGRSEEELQALLQERAAAAEETPQDENQQDPPQDPAEYQYSRYLIKKDVARERTAQINELIEKDENLQALLQVKAEYEGKEAADKFLSTFIEGVERDSERLVNRVWASKPEGTALNPKWLAPAVENAYNDRVDFVKSVVVDPAKLGRSPDAAGRDPVLEAEPVNAPDPRLWQTDPQEAARQGEAMLKHRSRVAAAKKRQRGAGGNQA